MTVTLLKGFSLNDSSMMTPRLATIAFFPLLPLVSHATQPGNERDPQFDDGGARADVQSQF